MIRRTVLVAFAAVALTLAPATAMAYAAPGLSCMLKDATPAPGVPFTVHASGATSNEAVTLTMTRNPTSVGNAGVRSVTKKANASGAVDFAVALTEDGVWVLVSTGSTGVVLGSQTVTVADHGTVILGGVSAGPDTAVGARAGKAPGAGPDTAVGAGAGKAVGAGAGKAAGAGPDTAAGSGKAPGAGSDTAAGSGAAPAAGPDTGSGTGARALASPPGGAIAGGPAAIGQLSRTGFQGQGLAVGGGLLVLVGAGAVLATRRGRWAQLPT